MRPDEDARGRRGSTSSSAGDASLRQRGRSGEFCGTPSWGGETVRPRGGRRSAMSQPRDRTNSIGVVQKRGSIPTRSGPIRGKLNRPRKGFQGLTDGPLATCCQQEPKVSGSNPDGRVQRVLHSIGLRRKASLFTSQHCSSPAGPRAVAAGPPRPREPRMFAGRLEEKNLGIAQRAALAGSATGPGETTSATGPRSPVGRGIAGACRRRRAV